MNLATLLKDLRTKKGLSQEELANKIFVSRTAVSKWETGKGYPSIESLKQLSVVFGVSVDSLISDQDLKEKKQLEEKWCKLFYILVICSFALTVLFVVLCRVFSNRLYMIGAFLSVFFYLISAYFVSPKSKREERFNKNKAGYIMSKLFAFLLVISVMLMSLFF